MKHTHTHTGKQDILRKFQYKSVWILISGGEVRWIGIGFSLHIFRKPEKKPAGSAPLPPYALQQPTDFMFGTHGPQSLKIVSESEIRSILDNKRKLHELWTVLGLASYIRFNEAFAIKHRNTPNISFQYVNVVGILGLILTSLSTIVNSHVCIYLICMFCLNTCTYI